MVQSWQGRCGITSLIPAHREHSYKATPIEARRRTVQNSIELFDSDWPCQRRWCNSPPGSPLAENADSSCFKYSCNRPKCRDTLMDLKMPSTTNRTGINHGHLAWGCVTSHAHTTPTASATAFSVERTYSLCQSNSFLRDSYSFR